MDLTHKQPSLIDDVFLPQQLKSAQIVDQYDYLKRFYNAGNTYILLNNVSVFGPFPEPELPWDISKSQKIAIYNPDVAKVLNWIMTRIVINLVNMDYKTLDVLIRIATGMLNKCDIPHEVKIMFHDNMVENLRAEHNRILLSELPF